MKVAGQNLVRFNPMGPYQNRARRLFAVKDKQTDRLIQGMILQRNQYELVDNFFPSTCV